VAGILPDVLPIWSLDVITNDKKQKYLSSGDEQKTLRFYTVQTFMEVPSGMMKSPEKTGLVLLKITLTLKV